jgi:hypothetical protein
MKFPFRVLFLCIGLLQIAGAGSLLHAQPFEWKVRDSGNGKELFSVLADSIFGLSSQLFALSLEKETILFKDNPFYPLLRKNEVELRPLNKRYFAEKGPEGWQLYSVENAAPARKGIFLNVKIWNGGIIAVAKNECLFIPENGEEIRADSSQISEDKLLLYLKDGIFWIDRQSATKFYRTPAANRKFNAPFFSYLRSDSSWLGLRGGPNFYEKNRSFWWNDTCLLDSSSTDVHIQSPGISRKKLTDSVVLESPDALWMKSGKRSFLLFSNGRKIPLKPHFERRAINDTLCAIRYAKGWTFHSSRGNRYPLKSVISGIGQVIGDWIMVLANGRWGCVDHTGIIRISCRYDSILPMSQGRMAVKLGKVWGFLDQDERIRIQPNYEWVQPFSDSICAAKLEGKFGLLGLSGHPVLPFQYDSIRLTAGGKWLVSKGKWAGLSNFKGKILLKPSYSDIIEVDSGLYRVERDGHAGLFDAHGNAILPLESKNILLDKANGILITR